LKRGRRRSTISSTFIFSVPATWLRKPNSLYCGTNSMPDLPSRNDFVTSAALLPIEETTPRPVTTTRFMLSARCRRNFGGVLEQSDLEAQGLIDRLAVGMHEAVGDAQDQLAQHHALEMHMEGQVLHRWHDHAGELDLADTQRPAAAGSLHPAQEEAQTLPQGVERQAARHHRVALEMAVEEPEVRLDIEFGHDLALAELAAGLGDLHDAVEHQHGRQRQLRVPRPEQAPAGAFDQVLESIAALLLAHAHRPKAARNRDRGQ